MDKNEVERISALAMFLVDQHEKETQTAGQNDNNPELYDYESCCSDNMILTENWQYTQKRQGKCRCTCGVGENGIAAAEEIIARGMDEISVELVDGKFSPWRSSNSEEPYVNPEHGVIIHCNACFEKSVREDWRFRYGRKIYEDRHTPEIDAHCLDCGEETYFYFRSRFFFSFSS
jgi:hypothetical protein